MFGARLMPFWHLRLSAWLWTWLPQPVLSSCPSQSRFWVPGTTRLRLDGLMHTRRLSAPRCTRFGRARNSERHQAGYGSHGRLWALCLFPSRYHDGAASQPSPNASYGSRRLSTLSVRDFGAPGRLRRPRALDSAVPGSPGPLSHPLSIPRRCSDADASMCSLPVEKTQGYLRARFQCARMPTTRLSAGLGPRGRLRDCYSSLTTSRERCHLPMQSTAQQDSAVRACAVPARQDAYSRRKERG